MSTRRSLLLLFASLLLFTSGCARLFAQSMDDLNLQIHGYATQSFLYSNQNSWNTTGSENGSAQWTEAVVNLSAHPMPKLRFGIQARYYLLGTFGNTIHLDWAQLDYKVDGRLGFRVGAVKSPMGLYNETQDIDPALLWSLLPQSIYPIASRDATLTHYGGVVYGTFDLAKAGKLDYRVYGGSRFLAPDDGFFQPFRDHGITLPNGIHAPIYGGTLMWHPARDLVFGATEDIEHPSGEMIIGALIGTVKYKPVQIPYLFAKYEHDRVYLAGEYERLPIYSTFLSPGIPPITLPTQDNHNYYVMASYKLTSKLAAGAYFSSQINHAAPGTGFEKDWVASARYDFNTFLYAKAEQHFTNGTSVGFAAFDNPNLQPTTRLTILKLGVTF